MSDSREIGDRAQVPSSVRENDEVQAEVNVLPEDAEGQDEILPSPPAMPASTLEVDQVSVEEEGNDRAGSPSRPDSDSAAADLANSENGSEGDNALTLPPPTTTQSIAKADSPKCVKEEDQHEEIGLGLKQNQKGARDAGVKMDCGTHSINAKQEEDIILPAKPLLGAAAPHPMLSDEQGTGLRLMAPRVTAPILTRKKNAFEESHVFTAFLSAEVPGLNAAHVSSPAIRNYIYDCARRLGFRKMTNYTSRAMFTGTWAEFMEAFQALNRAYRGQTERYDLAACHIVLIVCSKVISTTVNEHGNIECSADSLEYPVFMTHSQTQDQQRNAVYSIKNETARWTRDARRTFQKEGKVTYLIPNRPRNFDKNRSFQQTFTAA